jgi:pyruvate,water dikinase
LRPIEAKVAELLDRCDYGELESVLATSRALKAEVLGCDLLPELSSQLAAALPRLNGFEAFSVRSSATNEDGSQRSFAGQLGTWLNVPADQVEARVKDCWASAFDPGVLTYLHEIGRSPRTNLVSVVVQGLIRAESAGVLFQADPRGGTHRLVITAGFGLGEGVVSDKVESDLYVYDKLDQTWSLDVQEKSRRVDCQAGGGTEERPLPAEQREVAVLSDAQRRALLDVSTAVEALYERYQDVEWAFDASGELFVLQSRAITTTPGGFQRVFDNSNIIESYPGVVLPMTFSILHLDYYHCIRDALRLLGVPESVVRKREDALKHLVGYINGRSYYNLSNWYRVFLLAPWSERIIRSFEQMIGSDGAFAEDLDDASLSLWDRLRTGVAFPSKVALNLLRHDRLIRDYFAKSGALRRELEDLDLAAASSDELIGYLVHFTKRFMKLLSIPIMNDFFAMTFMAVTRKGFAQAGVAEGAESLLNELLSHQHIESTRPVRSVEALAARVRSEPALGEALREVLADPSKNQPAALGAELRRRGHPAFEAQLRAHLEAYGHRAPRELIMEADTFREDPFRLLSIVLELSKSTPVAQRSGADLDARLAEFLRRARRPRLLRWLLNKTRKAVAHREATRLDRGLLFGRFRELLHHLGDRLVAEGVLRAPRDVFYLTLDELDAFRKGCSPNNDLAGLVAYRKAQVKRWRALDQEEKLFTSGTVYANAFPAKDAPRDQGDGVLSGTGCSGGELTAEACLVTDPSAHTDVRGRIMVCETTDPGWVFLMTISAGLISERGSLLSHTAIIGRELGIPTVVGLKHATKLIKTGDSLTMNGETGAVTVHSRSEAHES